MYSRLSSLLKFSSTDLRRLVSLRYNSPQTRQSAVHTSPQFLRNGALLLQDRQKRVGRISSIARYWQRTPGPRPVTRIAGGQLTVPALFQLWSLPPDPPIQVVRMH